jgi:hypothetical protein
MRLLSVHFQQVLFRIYILTILILMVIRTDGKIRLAKTIWGFRGDHFVHSTIFIPYMIIIGFIYPSENNLYLITKKLPLAIAFGAFCESLHIFLPYRTFSIFDFFANCFGILMGLGLSFFSRKLLVESRK